MLRRTYVECLVGMSLFGSSFPTGDSNVSDTDSDSRESKQNSDESNPLIQENVTLNPEYGTYLSFTLDEETTVSYDFESDGTPVTAQFTHTETDETTTATPTESESITGTVTLESGKYDCILYHAGTNGRPWRRKPAFVQVLVEAVSTPTNSGSENSDDDTDSDDNTSDESDTSDDSDDTNNESGSEDSTPNCGSTDTDEQSDQEQSP